MEPKSSDNLTELFSRIAESDQQAFDKLFRAYYPALVSFACRYLKDKSTASDIVQDAFIKLWQKRSTLGGVESGKSYIYRIVRNLSLNYLRDNAGIETGLETENITHLHYNFHKADYESEREATKETRMRQLLDWIKKLPDRQREAFELSRFEGLDHHEIAGVMQVSARTVNNHIVEALKNLQRMRDMQSKKKTLAYHG